MPRTIVIGDVHGCARELDELLERLAVRKDDDVTFVGDLVARGPESRRVLRIARELGAKVALGNHEHKLLEARAAKRDGRPLPHLGASHQALLAELDAEEWAMLAAFPLKIDLGPALRVVHAGVVPGVPFEALDPDLVLRLRSISADGVPSKKWGPPWGARYTGPPHVVFGHNARRDPQLHPDATGLDTGCVYGGALTALVLPAGSPPPRPRDRRDALVQVQAHQAYVDFGRPLPAD